MFFTNLITLSAAIFSATTNAASVPIEKRVTAAVDKRGLCFNYPNYTQPFAHSASSPVSWAYSWASSPYYADPETASGSNAFNAALRYIPMLWNNNTVLTSIWHANVATAIADYKADAVLGFNEPDACQPGSSCMGVESSVLAWKKWIQPYQGKVLLGSPAVTNGVAPAGLAYLSRFFKTCPTCHVDFIAIHWYGSVLEPQALMNYTIEAHKLFPTKPIWLTEFGTTSGTPVQVERFLKAVLPWLDAQQYVHRYAYYMDRPGPTYLLLPNGKNKNVLGELYDA